MRNVIVASAVACGLCTAAIPLAGQAAAVCDSAGCVPNVTRGVAEGAPCAPSPSFVFGFDSNGGTLLCASQGAWVRVGAPVGEREVTQPCARPMQPAQA